MHFYEDQDFESFYVLAVYIQGEKKYYYSKRIFVYDLGLAKKFNTVRSAKRSARVAHLDDYKIIKLKKNDA